MDPSRLAYVQALGRVVLGAGLVVAPGALTRPWIGRGARSPGVQAVARGFGGRDVAIGLGTLQALSTGASPGHWVRAGIAGDAADLLATLLAWRALPRTGALTVAAMAGGSTVLGLWLQARADRMTPPTP